MQNALTNYEYVCNKSKFIALAYQVTTIEAAHQVLVELAQRHKHARHICFAYQIGPQAKYSDAGEPKGTAGRPLYHLLSGANLDNIIIVVVRYFGGTKLGRGRLLRSYVQAAQGALQQL